MDYFYKFSRLFFSSFYKKCRIYRNWIFVTFLTLVYILKQKSGKPRITGYEDSPDICVFLIFFSVN